MKLTGKFLVLVAVLLATSTVTTFASLKNPSAR